MVVKVADLDDARLLYHRPQPPGGHRRWTLGNTGGIGGATKVRGVRVGIRQAVVGVMSCSGGTVRLRWPLGRPAAGLGASTAISTSAAMRRSGSTDAELMPLFHPDEQTEAIATDSEPGGRMEAELVDWCSEPRRLPTRRLLPSWLGIVPWTMREMQGTCFGHALAPSSRAVRTSSTDTIDCLEAVGNPGRRADRRDPRRGQGEARVS